MNLMTVAVLQFGIVLTVSVVVVAELVFTSPMTMCMHTLLTLFHTSVQDELKNFTKYIKLVSLILQRLAAVYRLCLINVIVCI